jgi:hypothetical protein
MKRGEMMKNLKPTSKLIVVIALLAIASMRFTHTVRALDPQQLPASEFGIVSIVAGQTARLNVVNFPHNPGRPASVENSAAVQVTLTFFDASGHQITGADGQAVQTTATLNPGQATFLDLNADSFGPPITTKSPQPDPTGCGAGGCMIRPGVTGSRVNSSLSGNEAGQSSSIISTLELVDNSTRRTTVLYSVGPPSIGQN